MYDACVPWPERPKGAKDKSRGPKGLELEVGARRAPKILVTDKGQLSPPQLRRRTRPSSNLELPLALPLIAWFSGTAVSILLALSIPLVLSKLLVY